MYLNSFYNKIVGVLNVQRCKTIGHLKYIFIYIINDV
jgi:hypothetical protein